VSTKGEERFAEYDYLFLMKGPIGVFGVFGRMEWIGLGGIGCVAIPE
jgi:hypothetical protein